MLVAELLYACTFIIIIEGLLSKTVIKNECAKLDVNFFVFSSIAVAKSAKDGIEF